MQVMQADGGVLPAAMNAAVLALADAGVPLGGLVAACSAGHHSEEPLLDVNRRELTQLGGAVNVAVRLADGKAVAVHSECDLTVEKLQAAASAAARGCEAVGAFLRERLLERTLTLTRALGADGR